MGYGYSFNPVGMYPSSGYDYQCLLAAMKTPNALDPSFRGSSSQSAQVTDTTKTVTQQPPVQYVQPEKESHTGAWIAAGIGAAALILAGRYGYKNGPATEQKLFKRIFEGIKTGVGKIGKASTETAATTATEAVTQGKYTISEIVGKDKKKKTIVSLAGKKNVISTAQNKKYPLRDLNTANAELLAIGEEKFVPGSINSRFTFDATTKTWKINEGNELRSIVLSDTREAIVDGKTVDKAMKVIGVRDKNGNIVVTIVDPATKKKIFRNEISDYDKIEEKVKDIFAGKLPVKNDGCSTLYSDLDQVIVRNTNKETGLVSTIRATNKKGVDKEELLVAVSNKHSIDNEYVKEAIHDNPTLKESITKYKDKKFEGLPIIKADVEFKNKNGNRIFTIDKDNNIIAIKYEVAGKKWVTLDPVKDKTQFAAKCEDFAKDIEEIKKISPDKYTNVVYELPS